MKIVEIFDTNCFMEFYRSGKFERESIYTLFDSYINNEVFIPYQVMKELKENKDFHYRQHDKFKNTTTEAKSKLSNLMNEMYSKRFFSGEFKIVCEDFEKIIKKQLRKVINHHKNLVDEFYLELKDKDIIDLINDKFMIGTKFNTKTYISLLTEFRTRELHKIPPGCTDLKKKDNKHGDFFIWKEILQFANNKENYKIRFITAEKKNDWWDIDQDKRKISSFLLNEFNEIYPRLDIEFVYFFDYLKTKRLNYPELKIQSIMNQLYIKDQIQKTFNILEESILDYFTDQYDIDDNSSCFVEDIYEGISFEHISENEIECIIELSAQVNNYDDYEMYSISDITIKTVWKKSSSVFSLEEAQVLNVILGDNYMEPKECLRCGGENFSSGEFCAYCHDYIENA
ncbi:hypothetical protein KHQ88_01210 [Mycoplasmatota bacterium]|nr:hypothetical protein KHQ88_01210 [Mycoplasmatota bacterium]